MTPDVHLAPEADENGLASMLCELVRQNLEAKPHKSVALKALSSVRFAIVAEDASVAVTLDFGDGKLTIYGGIVGIPDVTVRGDTDSILGLSNMPLVTKWALPFAGRKDLEGKRIVGDMVRQMRSGQLRMFGAWMHPSKMLQLTRLMSVNG